MNETQELAVVQGVGGYVAALQRMASDPATDISKMEAMFRMHMEAMRYQAQVDFDEAMARLQPRLPAIVKTGVNANTKAGYAEYDKIVSIVRPLAAEEGFSWTFDTEPMANGPVPGMMVFGDLSRAGHTKPKKIWLPLDSGAGRSAVQSVGSSLSYGEKYLVKAMFGLVEVGADDDGMGGKKYEPLTRDHIDDLTTLIRDAKLGVKAVEQMCLIYKVKTINEIPDLMFADACARIQNRTAR